MFLGKVHQITTSLLRKIVKNTQTAKMRKYYRLKHQKLIQAIVVALVFIAMLSIIVGGVFIYCGSSFFVPGIIMTVISAAVLIAYLIFAVVFSFKNR